ncbi:hypothetical protein BsWGS_23407 [Bradybaena similaris]
MCLVYQQFKDCLKTALLDECALYPKMVDAHFHIEDFFCSEEGRALLAQARNSTCYSDQDRLYAIGIFDYSCFLDNSSQERRDDSQESGDDSQESGDDSQEYGYDYQEDGHNYQRDGYFCQSLVQTRQCNVQEATQECGQAVGTLVQGVFNGRWASRFPKCIAGSSCE